LKKTISIYIFSLTFFLCLFGNKLHSQFVKVSDYVLIAGYVFEEASSESLSYVNIYVKQTRRGTISDTSGFFILKARLNDTIIFSTITHERKTAVVTENLRESADPLIVFLEPRTYQLRSVDIIALRRYEQLKYEVINMKLPDDGFVYAIKNFPSRPVDIDYHSRAGVSDFGFVFSPITALYDAFSKEGREKRKLEELLEQDRKRGLIESRISVRKIGSITNLNEAEARQFLEWCNFSVEFILKINDYELIRLIMHRFEQYRRTSHYLEHSNRQRLN
jgi:hypothetical protein